jgi:tetratricopeptide (TPR) repeat protein
MTVEMLLAEMEGDVKLGKKEEARRTASEIEMGLNLMKTTLRRPVYWMKLARLQSDLGLTQDAKRSYDAGMERIQHLNPRLELLDLAYADAAYVRAKLENSKNSADMIQKRVEEFSQRDPGNPFPMPIMDEYFQMDALSTLAKGAWESGNPELALKLWDRALTLAEKNPNPRSKAIGAVEVLLSHAAVKQEPNVDLRKRLDKIRTGLPEDYTKLFMRNGGTE